MTPPLPAPSRPSKTTRTFEPRLDDPKLQLDEFGMQLGQFTLERLCDRAWRPNRQRPPRFLGALPSSSGMFRMRGFAEPSEDRSPPLPFVPFNIKGAAQKFPFVGQDLACCFFPHPSRKIRAADLAPPPPRALTPRSGVGPLCDREKVFSSRSRRCPPDRYHLKKRADHLNCPCTVVGKIETSAGSHAMAEKEIASLGEPEIENEASALVKCAVQWSPYCVTRPLRRSLPPQWSARGPDHPLEPTKGSFPPRAHAQSMIRQS